MDAVRAKLLDWLAGVEKAGKYLHPVAFECDRYEDLATGEVLLSIDIKLAPGVKPADAPLFDGPAEG